MSIVETFADELSVHDLHGSLVSAHGDVCSRLAAPVRAVLSALQFCDSSSEPLGELSESQWASLLPWCDGRQITLLLGQLCGHAIPTSVREQIAVKRSDFETRMTRITRQLRETSDVLSECGIPFVVLKGFTHSPELCPEPVSRAQGDIDLWCDPAAVQHAYLALQRFGYQSRPAHSKRHLPPLTLPEPWQWNGNLAEIPISVELHHQLWCEPTEHIRVPGLDEMWNRRERRTFTHGAYDVLAPPDLVGFAALHLFLHLAHGDLPLQRAWEIAYFLHTHANDVLFWEARDQLHSTALKQIETVVFQVVSTWFNCDVSDRLREETTALPEPLRLWLKGFAWSRLLAESDSNKNHLWLRIAMTSGLSARLSILGRALIPSRLPVFVDHSQETNRLSVMQSLVRQRTYLSSRVKWHAASIRPTAAGGMSWFARCIGFEPGFGPFLLASALFDVGEFLFVFLYSLYLLQLGYREDVIGLVAAAMTTGTLVGSFVAAAVQPRVGLRGLLVIASLGGGAATLLRIAVSNDALLLATAALNGLFFAFWAVAFPPVIAGVTRPRNRSVAFGLVTAMGMAIGIVVGLVAVRLTDWIVDSFAVSPIAGKRIAIVFGCSLVLLAAVPAARLKNASHRQDAGSRYPTSPFMGVFLAALFLWMLATNSFNSFGIPYLSLRLHIPARQIGVVFSAGQALQLIALVSGPLLVRKVGERRYIFLTSLGTACMLLSLSAGLKLLAIPAYLAYLAFQYMNEPTLFALLMNRVPQHDRSGASALMFVTMSVAGAVAAAVAGRMIARLDYGICLAIAAAIAAIAAALFLFLPDLASALQKHNNTIRQNP